MQRRPVAVIDFETDPFSMSRIPVPFAWGFFDGKTYAHHWQTDVRKDERACADSLLAFLAKLTEPHTILAHNGGRFDFFYLLHAAEGKITITNARIIELKIGKHTLRDSYAILPMPLSAGGGKKEIDYNKMERENREDNKAEILEYLETDCRELYKLVSAFYEEFGDKLTIGSASLTQLQKFHSFERASKSFDAQFRKFYFGGRCECFETGIIETEVNGFDINSSYPDVMRRLKHPVTSEFRVTGRVTDKTSFVVWSGRNHGAVPVREGLFLDFTKTRGTFYTSIHEFEAGLDTETIKPEKIHECYQFDQQITFADFIDYFYSARLKADAEGDTIHKIFYKFILNSAYGKFASNPENFLDSIVLPHGQIPETLLDSDGQAREVQYRLHAVFLQTYAIWSKPSPNARLYNVATAASITGGARASLLRGISAARRCLYVDTDSIFANELSAEINPKKLGAWKHEFTGDKIAIAGKKLYAVMKGDQCIKKASKGVNISDKQIFSIARGNVVEHASPVPNFKLDGNHKFITRRIKMTGRKNGPQAGR